MATDYLQLLEGLLPPDLANDDAQRRLQQVQSVLPVVLLAEESLSLATIDDLLDIPLGTTAQILQPLHSVIRVPDDFHQPISAVDPSFKKFLTDSKLCTDSRFVVAEGGGQGLFAQVCLIHANARLRRNICSVSAGELKAEVEDLQARLDQSISPALQYSCLHLASHLSKAPGDRDLVDLLDHFGEHKLLEWLEVLSLLGKVEAAIPAITLLRSWYSRLSHSAPLMSQLLQDALRLVLRFREVIDTSPGEIYQTALALAPDCPLRTTYFKLGSPWVLRGREPTWPLTICSYHGQSLVAHARDAPYLASGQWGMEKCKVYVRDSTKQTLVNTLQTEGDSDKDCGWLAISSDGRLVAAAPQVDEDLWIWDVASRERSELHVPNIYRVMCMAFGDNGSQFYALVLPKDTTEGQPTDMVRVWDTRTLSQVKAFYCSSETVAFALSPDDRTLVTLAGKDFEVFDVQSTERLRTFGTGDHLPWRRRGFTSVVAFLPDNFRFAVTVPRQSQATMEVYDSVRGILLYTLQGVQDDAGVAVSSTGLLACSKDGVHVIDTNVLPLGGSSWTLPAGAVASLAFTHDGTVLAVGENGLIRLMDVQGARKSTTPHITLNEGDDTQWDGEVYVSTSPADGTTYRVEWRLADNTLHVRSSYFHYQIPFNEEGLRDKKSVQDLVVSPDREHVAFFFRNGSIYPWLYDAQSRSCSPLQGIPQSFWDSGGHGFGRGFERRRLDTMPTNDRGDNKIRDDEPALLRFTDDGQFIYMNRLTTLLKWNVTDGSLESTKDMKESTIRVVTFNKESDRLLVLGNHLPGGWYKSLSFGGNHGPDGMHGEAHVSLFDYPSMEKLPIYLEEASFAQFHPVTGQPRFIIWREWMELVTETSRRRLLWIPPEWRDIYRHARVAHGRWDGSILTVYLKSQTLIFDVDAIERDVYGS